MIAATRGFDRCSYGFPEIPGPVSLQMIGMLSSLAYACVG